MKRLNTFAYLATFFTAAYAVFKFVQVPGAAWFMLFSGAMLAQAWMFLFRIYHLMRQDYTKLKGRSQNKSLNPTTFR